METLCWKHFELLYQLQLKLVISNLKQKLSHFRLYNLKFPDFFIFPTTMTNYIYALIMTHSLLVIDVKAVSHNLKWFESVLTVLTICLWIGFVNQQLALNLFSCQILYLSRLFIYITWLHFTWPLIHVIHGQFALSYLCVLTWKHNSDQDWLGNMFFIWKHKLGDIALVGNFK